MITRFTPEKYVKRLNKQMDKYINKGYLLNDINISEKIINPEKDICNYSDLLFNNPLKRKNDKIINIKRGVEND